MQPWERSINTSAVNSAVSRHIEVEIWLPWRREACGAITSSGLATFIDFRMLALAWHYLYLKTAMFNFGISPFKLVNFIEYSIRNFVYLGVVL